jgi:hypothetical protein
MARRNTRQRRSYDHTRWSSTSLGIRTCCIRKPREARLDIAESNSAHSRFDCGGPAPAACVSRQTRLCQGHSNSLDKGQVRPHHLHHHEERWIVRSAVVIRLFSCISVLLFSKVALVLRSSITPLWCSCLTHYLCIHADPIECMVATTDIHGAVTIPTRWHHGECTLFMTSVCCLIRSRSLRHCPSCLHRAVGVGIAVSVKSMHMQSAVFPSSRLLASTHGVAGKRASAVMVTATRR